MKNKMPLLSIIVPIYNSEMYLKKCLTSICKQTYYNLEIILVDDGSNDNSLKICNSFAERDKRIKVISQSNCGASAARNTGLSVATGEYVTFVDSDDWLELIYVEVCLSQLLDDDADVICCALSEYRNGHFLRTQKGFLYEHHIFEKEEFSSIIEKMFSCHGDDGWTALNITGSVCKIYKKNKLYNSSFNTSLKYAEDLCFFLQVIQQVDRISFVCRSYYNRLIHQNSVSNSYSNNHYRQALNFIWYVWNNYAFENVQKQRRLFNLLEQEVYLSCVRSYVGYIPKKGLKRIKRKQLEFSKHLPMEIDWKITKEDYVTIFFVTHNWFWLYRIYKGCYNILKMFFERVREVNK